MIFSGLSRYLSVFTQYQILDTLCPKSGMRLGWSHYRVLLQVEDAAALRWYADDPTADGGQEDWLHRLPQLLAKFFPINFNFHSYPFSGEAESFRFITKSNPLLRLALTRSGRSAPGR